MEDVVQFFSDDTVFHEQGGVRLSASTVNGGLKVKPLW